MMSTRPFEAELADLKTRLLEMGALAETMVRDAVLALRTRDARRADEVVARDDALDRMEIEVEDRCVHLLALRQPLARDLRLVTMALKISNDLERVGDHALDIALAARELDAVPLQHFPEISEMAAVASEMLTDALDHFLRGDAVRARAVTERDAVVDELQETFTRTLLERMVSNARWIGPALGLLVIGRNLERIADLATNIAEDVVYLVEGHPLPPRRTKPVEA